MWEPCGYVNHCSGVFEKTLALWISIDVNNWTSERAIIASYDEVIIIMWDLWV